jgi:hypothetical protein
VKAQRAGENCKNWRANGERRAVGEKERAGLRRLALTWLREGLAAFRGLKMEAGSGIGIRRVLYIWKNSKDLEGLREPAGLAKLPAAERASWRKFWGEVDALLEKTHLRSQKPPKGGTTNSGKRSPCLPRWRVGLVWLAA